MANFEVTDFVIIKILAEDYIFSKNWRLFCRAANMKDGVVRDLEKMDSQAGIFAVVTDLMKLWKSSAGSDANTNKLSEILLLMDCNNCSERIKDEISKRTFSSNAGPSKNVPFHYPDADACNVGWKMPMPSDFSPWAGNCSTDELPKNASPIVTYPGQGANHQRLKNPLPYPTIVKSSFNDKAGEDISARYRYTEDNYSESRINSGDSGKNLTSVSEIICATEERFCLSKGVQLFLQADKYDDSNFRISDENGKVYFSIKDKIFTLQGKKVLKDFGGRPVLNMKNFYDADPNTWKIYAGNSSRIEVCSFSADQEGKISTYFEDILNGKSRHVVIEGYSNGETMTFLGDPDLGGVPLARTCHPVQSIEDLGSNNCVIEILEEEVDIALMVIIHFAYKEYNRN